MTAEVLEKPKSAQTNLPALVIADRCDRCRAQAFVRARKGDSILLFCGHHGRNHETALIIQGWDVEDFRHLINAAPSSSSGTEK